MHRDKISQVKNYVSFILLYKWSIGIYSDNGIENLYLKKKKKSIQIKH